MHEFWLRLPVLEDGQSSTALPIKQEGKVDMDAVHVVKAALLTRSNKKAKSTWTASPVVASSRMFSPCLSPRPTMCPTMDHTAVVLVKASRAVCQVAGSGKRARNQRCSTGGYNARQLVQELALALALSVTDTRCAVQL